MVCLESVFAGLRQVCFFLKKVTVSDRKPRNLNFTLLGPGDVRPSSAEGRLSLDNLPSPLQTGGH